MSDLVLNAQFLRQLREKSCYSGPLPLVEYAAFLSSMTKLPFLELYGKGKSILCAINDGTRLLMECPLRVPP